MYIRDICIGPFSPVQNELMCSLIKEKKNLYNLNKRECIEFPH